MTGKRCAHGWLNHADCEVCNLLAECESLRQQLASRDAEIAELKQTCIDHVEIQNSLREQVKDQRITIIQLRAILQGLGHDTEHHDRS